MQLQSYSFVSKFRKPSNSYSQFEVNEDYSDNDDVNSSAVPCNL